MTYRALTFYLISIAAILGILRLIERPQGASGPAIAAALRARLLAELSLLVASFLIYWPWTWILGDSPLAIAGGLILADSVGLAAWWIMRQLTAPPPPTPPLPPMVA